ncbi:MULTISPECIES: hypothetical protein [Flavobacteriales]|uniref:Uncharacterized protein n=1 Tax=Flavobacterium microcysteis TaxID=2596891 RepID=A0A501Q752_9FLAO|nr:MULTISPECIES: hypothetical protein [Flavobacteriales]AZA58612.1 hypothetical protein EG350_16100 [Chryseobacterium shandongense]TPD68493.1 hypothetical protein FJA49_10535 [Flavobacterium microcysteis]
MAKSEFQSKKPNNIREYIELANDISDYKNRLKAIDFLSKYKCYESKKELYRLMKTDKIFAVKEQAFRALQNFGEDVRLTKKKKGKSVKTINDKLLILHNSFNGDPYTLTDFKIKFKDLYPYIYDIYNYEKKSKFDSFITSSIKTFAKRKIKHNYSINISFDAPDIFISREIFDMEYKGSSDTNDELEIKNDTLTIRSNRSAKINLINIVFSESNSIHNQIIKSLIYYYIKVNRFVPIKSISINRIKQTGEDTIISLPTTKIAVEQILNEKFISIDISTVNINDLFKSDDKSKAIQYALTYLLKSKITNEQSERFEKLWKSFNSIYHYLGNGANENECHRLIRNFILTNPTLFSKSHRKAKAITIKELREKVRFYELLSNDYDTKEKIVSFIAFVFRYQNKVVCKNLLDNISYFETDLKDIFNLDKVESKFNKFDYIKDLYHNNKSSSDKDIIFKKVKDYLEDKVKNPVPNTELEITAFICLKYCYYLRNKIFHAEKQDLTFRFAKNNLIFELEWVNEILETLIVELISTNVNWTRKN